MSNTPGIFSSSLFWQASKAECGFYKARKNLLCLAASSRALLRFNPMPPLCLEISVTHFVIWILEKGRVRRILWGKHRIRDRGNIEEWVSGRTGRAASWVWNTCQLGEGGDQTTGSHSASHKDEERVGWKSGWREGVRKVVKFQVRQLWDACLYIVGSGCETSWWEFVSIVLHFLLLESKLLWDPYRGPNSGINMAR